MELRLKVLELGGKRVTDRGRQELTSSMLNSAVVNDKMLRIEEMIKKCKDAESESAKEKAARRDARINADCAAAARRS